MSGDSSHSLVFLLLPVLLSKFQNKKKKLKQLSYKIDLKKITFEF